MSETTTTTIRCDEPERGETPACSFCGLTSYLVGGKRFCPRCNVVVWPEIWNNRPIEAALRDRVRHLEGLMGRQHNTRKVRDAAIAEVFEGRREWSPFEKERNRDEARAAEFALESEARQIAERMTREAEQEKGEMG